jgi:hypothetical protein
MNAQRRHARPAEDPAVIDWRRRMLGRAGFDPERAEALARDPRYDLHALIELTERGCPPPLAERILGPLGSDSNRRRETP